MFLFLTIYLPKAKAQLPFNHASVNETKIIGHGSTLIKNTACDALKDNIYNTEMLVMVCDGTQPSLGWEYTDGAGIKHQGVLALKDGAAENPDVVLEYDASSDAYVASVVYFDKGSIGVFLENYFYDKPTLQFKIVNNNTYPMNIGAQTGAQCLGTVNMDLDIYNNFVVVFDAYSSNINNVIIVAGTIDAAYESRVINTNGIKLSNPLGQINGNEQPDVSLAATGGILSTPMTYLTYLTIDNSGKYSTNVMEADDFPYYNNMNNSPFTYTWWAAPSIYNSTGGVISHPTITSNIVLNGFS